MPQEGYNHERERRALMKDEEEIGENIPETFHGVEGADVGEVRRHGHVRDPETVAEEEHAEDAGKAEDDETSDLS